MQQTLAFQQFPFSGKYQSHRLNIYIYIYIYIYKLRSELSYLKSFGIFKNWYVKNIPYFLLVTIEKFISLTEKKEDIWWIDDNLKKINEIGEMNAWPEYGLMIIELKKKKTRQITKPV